jgi:hypothetical protein
MLRRDRPRLQYNPLFRDSSSNYPFEDIFLYDTHTRSNSIDEKDEKDKELDAPGCFYWFNKKILNFFSYFTES